MNVDYYSYKVEFQDRGAGHAHGTLWLNLDKIENLLKDKDGTLRPRNVDDDPNKCGPFHGIKVAFKKLRSNTKLENEDKNALREFIDEYTTVSIHENTVGEDVAKIAQEVNKHHHTKTCRKHDTTCRFNYPRYPAPHTIIVEPCKEETTEAAEAVLIRYREILRKVRVVLENEDAVKEIMMKYDKQNESKEEYKKNTVSRIKQLLEVAGVEDYDEYLRALGTSKTGYSVVQRRDLDEIYINSYNTEWLRAWNGNMDIQVVLDYFAVITYVTDYYAKDDTGTMEIIKAVLEDTTTKDLKEKMRTISNVFLTHRQMGEAEAVYRLLPSMTLKKSNVACQWVSLGPKEERSSRWKKATQKEKESGRHVTELMNHDGFWYEQQDMWSKYLRRPESLEDMCCAQFAKMFRTSRNAQRTEEEVGIDEDEENDPNNDEGVSVDQIEIPEGEDKFNYIMTYETQSKKGPVVPDIIVLKDPYPNEPSMMVKREFPAVLRFNKSNKDNNPMRYMLSELMLYRPTREEIDMDQVESLYEEMHNGSRKIDVVKSQVMEHLEGVEEARYYVEQIQKELDLSETANKLDPTLEQDNADCDEEATSDHPDFLHIDPGMITTEESSVPRDIYRRVDIPSSAELKENTRSLDKYQREVVNIGIKYAKDIVKARKEGNKAPEAPLLMVHGGAGAGKSTVIKVLAQWMQKILQKEGDEIDCPCVIKTAFTGTAASNIEGQTLHASFGFSFDNKHYTLSDKSRDKKKAALKNLKIVIIDEISMMKSDMLYQMDLRLQEITGKVGVPFGGVAIFAFGDMMQLKPCMGHYICDEPINKEFKIVHAMKPRWQLFKSLILEKNHRQGNDRPYAELLNRIRTGDQTAQDIELLKTRVRPANHPELKEASLYIVCKRMDCARTNAQYLNSLKGDYINLKARHHHATQKNYKPFIEPKEGAIASTSFINELQLKIGAKIMIIHNIDTADGLTNGQLGELVTIIRTTKGEVDKLIVRLKKKNAGQHNRSKFPGLASRFPNCVIIERVSNQYTLRKKGGDVSNTATLFQFPVKLAHAITAHKIQGQTIPYPVKVVLDLNSIFEDAQAHVMLSRVQQLEQVFILNKLEKSKIRTSHIGLKELQRLKAISINENPTEWNRKTENTIKVVSLNCAGLKAHTMDILADDTLKEADIIHLIETSLDTMEEVQFTIPGYSQHYINVGNGKGIASFFKDNVFKHEQDYVENSMQITKFSSKSLDVINVYRSSNGHSVELLNHLRDLLTMGKTVLITGDFNICYQTIGNNRLSKGLETNGFIQLVKEATHIRGGHIDHVYWRDVNGGWKAPHLQRYSPYYSDHDGSCVTLMKRE